MLQMLHMWVRPTKHRMAAHWCATNKAVKNRNMKESVQNNHNLFLSPRYQILPLQAVWYSLFYKTHSLLSCWPTAIQFRGKWWEHKLCLLSSAQPVHGRPWITLIQYIMCNPPPSHVLRVVLTLGKGLTQPKTIHSEWLKLSDWTLLQKTKTINPGLPILLWLLYQSCVSINNIDPPFTI